MNGVQTAIWESIILGDTQIQAANIDSGDTKSRYMPIMGGMTKKTSMTTIHGDKVQTHIPDGNTWEEDAYRKAFDDMDAFSLSFHSTEKYLDKKEDIYLYKKRQLTPKERHPDNVEMQTFGRTNDILDKIDFYMTKLPDVKPIKINRFSDIEGQKGFIKRNESGDIVHSYPLNEDITLRLVEIADNIGHKFQYKENNDMCEFTILSEKYE